MLEAKLWESSAFLTLTYDDGHVPPDGSLDPRHVQLFLKRLRNEYNDRKIRYYAVGEYGDISERPHYHLALFNFPACPGHIRGVNNNSCDVCDRLARCWGMGHILLGELNEKTAAYIGGYVLKKWTRPDESRLDGRHPEFARMSLKPGIGAGAMHEVASVLMTYHLEAESVPMALRHGKKQLPLGRYLRRQLRILVGLSPDASEAELAEHAEKLRPMYEKAKKNSPNDAKLRALLFSQYLFDASEGKIASIEARSKIYQQRKSI